MPHIKPVIYATGFSHMWRSFYRKYQICICQILEYVWLLSDDIISCHLQLGLKISWYYLGVIRILKILSSCHDILLLWKLANSKTNNKTKQTIMNFAGKMWHCKISVFYTPPFLLPPFKLWPPHEFDIIPRYWGQFPTRRGSWQSVLIKLWQYSFVFVLQIPAKTKWKLHHFLGH